MVSGSALSGAAVLAHQGGWDEILMVAVPILIILAVLRVVKRRVDRGDWEKHPDLREPARPTTDSPDEISPDEISPDEISPDRSE